MNIGKGDVESYVLPYSSNINNILLVATILNSYDEYIINEQRRLTLLIMQKQYLLTPDVHINIWDKDIFLPIEQFKNC